MNYTLLTISILVIVALVVGIPILLKSNLLKKKQKTSLSDDDVRELKALERQSYMEEARKLIVEKGKIKAQEEFIPKVKKEGY